MVASSPTAIRVVESLENAICLIGLKQLECSKTRLNNFSLLLETRSKRKIDPFMFPTASFDLKRSTANRINQRLQSSISNVVIILQIKKHTIHWGKVLIENKQSIMLQGREILYWSNKINLLNEKLFSLEFLIFTELNVWIDLNKVG